MEFKFSNNLCIQYGTEYIKRDITNKIHDRRDQSNISYIPKGNGECDGLFGDPVPYIEKDIFITCDNCTYKINQKFHIIIDYKNNIINIDDKPKPKYNFCIMAIFKNETMNLKLWLDHYLWQGVDHFYLIDNGSTDYPLYILNEYISKGIVTYYHRDQKHQQPQHYRYVFDKEYLMFKTKWLCICDLDEFFFGTEVKLSEAINRFDNYDVIIAEMGGYCSGHGTSFQNYWLGHWNDGVVNE
jgi:hypothetical protein